MRFQQDKHLGSLSAHFLIRILNISIFSLFWSSGTKWSCCWNPLWRRPLFHEALDAKEKIEEELLNEISQKSKGNHELPHVYMLYIYIHRALKSCGGRVWRSFNVWGDAGCTTVCDPEDGRYHYCGYTHSECACQHCVPRKKLAVAFHRIQVHDMTPEWKFDRWSRIQGSSLSNSFEDMEDDDEFVVFK